jgi:hypothetical protein
MDDSDMEKGGGFLADSAHRHTRAGWLFHKLWGMAQDGDPYSKRVWKELAKELEGIGVTLNPSEPPSTSTRDEAILFPVPKQVLWKAFWEMRRTKSGSLFPASKA